MIHKVERGESSPTATLLARLSGAFGMSMSTLLARAETRGGRLLRHEDQPVWQDPQTGYLRRHVSPETGLPLDVVEVALPPGAEVPMPAAAYAFRRHLIWAREGELTFIEGGERHHLRPGDCLELGPPMDCLFRNDGPGTCQYVVIVLREAQAAP